MKEILVGCYSTKVFPNLDIIILTIILCVYIQRRILDRPMIQLNSLLSALTIYITLVLNSRTLGNGGKLL